jgi:TPR repeat protein
MHAYGRDVVENLELGIEWYEKTAVQGHIYALNDLAWIRATYPNDRIRNGVEAVKHAARACKLTGRKQAITLAAAYAETGRFDDAVKAAQEARDLALAAGETELANKNLELVELFRSRQHYRLTVPGQPEANRPCLSWTSRELTIDAI